MKEPLRAATLVAVMDVDEARLTSFGQEFGTRSAPAFSRVPVTPGQLAPGTPFYGQMNGGNLAW